LGNKALKSSIDILCLTKNPDLREDGKLLARAYNSLAWNQNNLKNWLEALDAASKSVELRQELFAKDPNTYCSDLALSLASFSAYHNQLGNSQAALDAVTTL
jgi:hypothetical protein